MSYIVLNGRKSDTVTGLLISSLPPISKPLLRTEVEEIDGRDGDIITPLGYSAYDKEMTIGLYGAYDIDDVISYFDSEGTVIFSNEPDKYYKYKIIEQVDFEKLIRYKTATVTFHVQPFKYSVVDGVIEQDAHILSIPDFSQTENGMTLLVSDEEMFLSGTSTKTAEFFIPVELHLESGKYMISATGSGDVGIGLITTSSSYGAMLKNGLTDTVINVARCDVKYIWVCVYGEQTINSSITVDLKEMFVRVTNQGNTRAKPIITLHGSGNSDITINGEYACSVNLTQPIVIDVNEMQAYNLDGSFANRRVSGDYDGLMLPVGTSQIGWTGDVDTVTVERYSRWI